MKILIFTDTTPDQTNGVQVTLNNLLKELKEFQYETEVVNPNNFKILTRVHGTAVCLVLQKQIAKYFRSNQKFAVHILTEGGVGLAARKYCLKHNIKYTTSLLTFWDMFLLKNFYIPKFLTNYFMKWFHSKSSGVMVSTTGMNEYVSHFNDHILIWPKGVSEIFHPYDNKEDHRALFVGRISKEKDIEDFLELEIPYKKIVVGDGPLLKTFKSKYPDVEFKGLLFGEELAKEYSKASIFVFPSKFDTFGLVVIEALSCGTPVAAKPCGGPSFIIKDPRIGSLDYDLVKAIKLAETLFNKDFCLKFCEQYKWNNSAEKFINNLSWNEL